MSHGVEGDADAITSVEQTWAEWLADPSRTGTTSPEVVRELVGRATGRAPSAIQRLFHGESNEVYDVLTDDGGRIVVRLGHRAPSLFPAERWAIESAAAQGAAVPQVLLVESLETEDRPLSACIQRHAGGDPLQQLFLDGGAADAWEEVVREAGRQLALVHRVETEGFGWPLDDRGRGLEDSWGAFLTIPAREPDWYEPAINAVGYPTKRFERALALLDAHADAYAGPPKLLHGDFGPKHVLANGGLRALIDFEVCRGGDPAYDIATWDIYFHNSLRTEWLLEGYREVTDLGTDFEVRLQLCLILFAIRLLGQSANGFNGFVALATKTLDRELDRFDG